MKKFAEIVLKLRTAIVVTTVVVTLILGYFIKDLKINPDIFSYLPKNDPVVKLFDYIGEKYGGNYLAIVALETDDVFSKETIERVNQLTNEFKLVDGVSYVTSLTNILDIKKGEDGIEIGKLIDEYNLPQTDEELKKLKSYTLSKDIYRGRLVSPDSKVTLIICRLREDVNKIEVARQLKEIVKKMNLKAKVHYSGLPFQFLDLTEIILNDLKFLVPIVSLLIIISLFFSFRSLRGVLLPMVSVLISTIWTLGIMSILRVPLTVISDIIPVILVAVGTAYSIHVVSKFDEELSSGEDKIKRAQSALNEVGVPVILAGVTTIAGFISFVFGSYLTAISQFGIFSSLGILFALIISLTFTPSVLSLSSPKRKMITLSENFSKKNGVARFMDKIGEWVLTNEKAVIVCATIVVVLCFIGIPKIERRVDMLDYFRPKNPIRITEEMMQKKFGGSVPVQILVKGDIQDPSVLKQMKKIEDFLKTQDNVHNPQSVADLIEEMNDVMDEGRMIPDSRDKVSNLWFLLEGEDIMSQLVNPEKTEAVIQATLGSVDTKRGRKLIKSIDDYIKKINDPSVTFIQAGIPMIYRNLDDSIINSQIRSLIIALILVFISLVFLSHSITGGLIDLTPIVFTLMVIFGFMGFAKIPLDIATVLVGSISIGIGIDYSIHCVSRFRKEFEKSSSELEALDKTLETTGKAILINVLTVTMGFLVLVLAELVPLRRFGILVAITMVSSGIGAITLLPAIILFSKAGFIGDFSRFINGAKNRLIKELKGGD